MPLSVLAFIGAMMIHIVFVLPVDVTNAAGTVQTALLAMALFSLGTAVRLGQLFRTVWCNHLVALPSSVLTAAPACVAVHLG